MSDDYLYETFNVDKPENYEQIKADNLGRTGPCPYEVLEQQAHSSGG